MSGVQVAGLSYRLNDGTGETNIYDNTLRKSKVFESDYVIVVMKIL